jgi:hypothetical protein
MLQPDRAALGDPIDRVYAEFTDLPPETQSMYLRRLVRQVVAVYREDGPSECAMLLRRNWALDASLSWRILLYCSRRVAGDGLHLQDHILVLREIWALAIHRDPQILIGESVLEILGWSPEKIAAIKAYGAWREWRSRAIGWLVSLRPTRKHRRQEPFRDWPEDMDEQLLALWPLPAQPPEPVLVQEFLQRVHGWRQEYDKHERTLHWCIRDPLSVRATLFTVSLCDWMVEVKQGDLSRTYLEAPATKRGRPRKQP